MYVKWHKKESKRRNLNGGGRQGGTFGIIEYLSQSNTNANCVANNRRWKWVDDLTILEVINLINIGMSSFNIKNQVPNYINVNKNFLPTEHLETQTNLNQISDWTGKQKMMLNINKTNYMIFNFTTNHQFSTRISINEALLKKKKM